MTEETEFNPYELAHEHAGYLGIKINEGESEDSFRNRVATTLRQNGDFIEAHEVISGRLYDDPNGDTMTGVIGALAQEFTHNKYSPDDPNRQIGDDIATGILVNSPKGNNSDLASLIELLGPDGLSLLLGGDKK